MREKGERQKKVYVKGKEGEIKKKRKKGGPKKKESEIMKMAMEK